MFKIMLVDDDYLMRDDIKKMVDWSSLGCEVCVELSDGERAYSLLNVLEPDIIVTDLQMPYMDGLTLSRLVKKEKPDVEIIMVTSCTDYNCMREAMRIGIADYIIKPADSDELCADIRMITERIAERRREKELIESSRENIAKTTSDERDQLFDGLVSSVRTPADMIEMAGKYNVNLISPWYNIILIDIISESSTPEDGRDHFEMIYEEIREIAAGDDIYVFNRGLAGIGILIKGNSSDEIKVKQNEYLEQIKNILYKYDYIKFCGGVGEAVERLSELSASYEKACRAFAHSYILRENLIIESGELEHGLYVSGDSYGISNVTYSKTDRENLYKFLKFGDEKDVERFVEGLFAEIGEDALNSGMVRNYIVVDMYMSICDFLEGFELDKGEIEAPDITYEILQNKDNSRKYLVNILEKAMAARETTTKGRYNDIVDEMMRYIDENYADDKLSLNQLAAHVNFSPNHLSMIFSQQTGRTFIKYLTEYRMNKAKEMLRYTGKRSSEVSVEVGYKDPHYFSYLFKKTQGMTPTAYRNLKVDTEDA